MIKRCNNCAAWDRVPAAAYQDKKYGKGLRVHNPGSKGDKCTVCGTVRDSGQRA